MDTLKKLTEISISRKANESKEKIKKYEELWIKIRDLIRSITKNSENHNGKCMKIKSDSDTSK